MSKCLKQESFAINADRLKSMKQSTNYQTII